MKNIYEEAGGTHQRQGDYELFKLKAPTEREAEIGVWRQRYRRCLPTSPHLVLQPTNCRSPE